MASVINIDCQVAYDRNDQCIRLRSDMPATTVKSPHSDNFFLMKRNIEVGPPKIRVLLIFPFKIFGTEGVVSTPNSAPKCCNLRLVFWCVFFNSIGHSFFFDTVRLMACARSPDSASKVGLDSKEPYMHRCFEWRGPLCPPIWRVPKLPASSHPVPAGVRS